MTNIGTYAFKNCPSLQEVTLLNPKVDIIDDAFFGCKVLTVVNLSEGLTWEQMKDKFAQSPWGEDKPG